VNKLEQIMEYFALDWLPILVDERKFPTDDGYDAKLDVSFKEQGGELKGDALKVVINELEKLRDTEEKRLDTIESKAFSLISLTGLASTFAIGLIEFNISDHPYPQWFRIVTLILYAMIGFCFIITTVLARRAIHVGRRPFMAPDIANLWTLNQHNGDEVYQGHAASLLKSYMHNRAVINDKATYVRGAQDWFRNTVVLLFLVPIIFGSAALVPAFQVTTTATPNVLIIVTNTPTFTPTYTATVLPTPIQSATPS